MKELKRRSIASMLILSIITSLAFLCITANQMTSFAQGDESLSISGVPCETQTLYAITANMSGALSYQWKYSDTVDGTYANISGATSDSYTLPSSAYNGKFIKVTVTDNNGSYTSESTTQIGGIINLDITNGIITIGLNGEYTYYDAVSVLQTGTHNENNYYMITGASGTNANGLGHNIRLAGSGNFNVVLDNISIYTGTSSLGSGAPFSTASVTESGNINLYLKGDNTLKNISTNPSDSCAAIEKNVTSSTLIISSWDYNYKTDTPNGICGSVNAVGGADSSAIGGSDTIYYASGSTVASMGATRNITIMSGIINASTTCSQAAGIGAGNNSPAYNIRIYGGDIIAIGFDNGAGIGGSGGVTGVGNTGEVSIYGGKINARSNGNGASIGGGGANTANGGEGLVSIYGGDITAKTIGGARSETDIGGNATVRIYSGTVKADYIGGGFSRTYGYANASIEITGGSVNSRIAGTPTNGTEQVYLTRATLYEADVIKANYPVSSLTGYPAYGMNDVKTNEKGILYLWLPKNVEITEAVSDKTFTGNLPSSYSSVLKYNCSQYYYAVNMGISDRFNVYSDAEYENELDGSITVPSYTALSLYLLKESAYSEMSVRAYKSTQNDTMEEISGFGINNNASFIVTGDTMVWFETIYNGASRLELDLLMGDITIEEDTGTAAADDFIINQNGRSLHGYVGDFYITSGGKGASNRIIIKSGSPNVYLDKLISESNESLIEIRSGTVDLTYSSYDNQLKSDNDSAIKVLEGGVLNLISATASDSLKLIGGANSPAIGGTGEVNITKTSGFLVLTKGVSAGSQIEAGKYSYSTNLNTEALPYTLSLNPGTLVGYNRSDDNKLYLPNAVQAVSEVTTFTAFGIAQFNLLNGVTNGGGSINANGDYEITLTGADSVSVRRGETGLAENTEYTFVDATDKLTILNTAAYGSVSISATAQGTILYRAQSHSGAYDGASHAIRIEVLNPADASVKFGISSGTYNLDSAPAYTDVGTYTVYYQISKVGYTTVTGSGTVTITMGTNEWISTIRANSVLEGVELNPVAVSKWETPTYLYSTTLNGAYTDVKPTAVGTYYVKATAVGSSNYNELIGEAVKVVIEPFSIYTGVGRLLSQLDLAYKGTTVTLPANDAYTMRYVLAYIPDTANPLKLEFGRTLSAGTRLTLIDFSDGIASCYYYNVDSGMDSVNLTQFVRMGASTHFAEKTEGFVATINYQICVDLPNGIGAGDLTADFHRGSAIIPNTTTTAVLTQEYIPTGSVTIGTASTDENNKIVAPITVSAVGTKNKIVSVSLLDAYGASTVFPTGTSVKLGVAQPSEIRGNVATFDLGTGNLSNRNYTVYISGLEAGAYKVRVDISEVDSGAVNYPLGGSLASAVSDTLAVTDSTNYALRVTTMHGQTRNVDGGSDIDLKLTYKASETGALTIKRVRKLNNNYDGSKTDESFKTASSGTAFGGSVNSYTTSAINTATDVNVRLVAPNTAGTYRYYFYFEDTEIRYNIIVE